MSSIKHTACFLFLLSLMTLPAVAQDDTSRNFVVQLSGEDEVPPNNSRARGVAIFHVINDGTGLAYKLIVANIENVVASHIHIGASDENGPVTAFLFGPAAPAGGRVDGPIARGVITADDLIGPLAGQPLSALLEQIEAGNAYVNVHTNDGEDPTNTGPGDFPGGEIRGQFD